MRAKTSTVIIGAVTAAYVIFIVGEFAGVFGHHPGKLSAGMIAMLILLMALLVGDWSRNRGKSGADV